MANDTLQNESAPASPEMIEAQSNLLPFPARNKGRIRKSRSLEAMGRCSVSILEREGESIPANVADFRSAREEKHIDDGRLALCLSLALFATVSTDQKKSIRNAVRMYARNDDGQRGDECRALYHLLTGENPSC